MSRPPAKKGKNPPASRRRIRARGARKRTIWKRSPLNLIDDQPGYQKAGYEKNTSARTKATARRMQPAGRPRRAIPHVRRPSISARCYVCRSTGCRLGIARDAGYRAIFAAIRNEMSHLAPKASQCDATAGVLRKTLTSTDFRNGLDLSFQGDSLHADDLARTLGEG